MTHRTCPAKPQAGSKKSLRSDLGYCSWDGFLSNAMTGAGETFFPAFALAIGGSQVGSGLITAVPFLVGSTIQLAAPWCLARVGSYRRWIASLAALQALCFVPLIWMALKGQLGALWPLYLIVSLYWIFSHAASPAWNSWVAHLVPSTLRPRYFAHRSRLTQIGLLFGLACGGVVLNGSRASGRELAAFAALFAVSALFRFASAFCLLKHSDASEAKAHEATRPLSQTLKSLLQRRQGGQVKLFSFMMIFAVATHFSSPFFNAFMLQQLHLKYVTYITLVSVSYFAKIATYASISRHARHLDPLSLMRVGLIGAALSPLSWMLGSSFGYLVLVQIFGGMSWALYEMGLMLTLFGAVKDDERTNILSLFNFGSALTMVLGASLGGELLHLLGENKNAFFVVFAISTVLRLASIAPLDWALRQLRLERADHSTPRLPLAVLVPRPARAIWAGRRFSGMRRRLVLGLERASLRR